MRDLVLDACVWAELLVGSPVGQATARLIGPEAVLHAPELAVAEVLSVLRKWEFSGALDARQAAAAFARLQRSPVRAWPLRGLAPRIWELRGGITPYDAAYVALSEAIRAEFVTADLRLARAVAGSARCGVVPVERASHDGRAGGLG